jgi:hypothetical protein
VWLDPPNSGPECPEDDLVGEMTTTEVMWFLRAKNKRAANAWLVRHKVRAHSREPGIMGDNLYWRKAVVEAKRNMPGQGKGGGWHMHKKRRKEAPQ